MVVGMFPVQLNIIYMLKTSQSNFDAYSERELKAVVAYLNEEKVRQLEGIESKSMTTSPISCTEKGTLDTKSHVSKGDWHFLAVFGCLSLINLMCAIDATILSVALPVRHTPGSAMLSSLLS